MRVTSGASTVNHDTVEGEALVERYANGTLSAEDAAGFEEHLVDCAHCVDRLQWTERLRDGLRQHASAIAPRGREAAREPVRFLALAAGLVAAAVGGWALVEFRAGWQRELSRSQAEADGWRGRYEQARDASSVRPLANVAVLALSATRGPAAVAPPRAPTQGRDWLLLSLEVEPDPALRSYAVRVTAPDGREHWRVDGLAPAQSAVTLVLPAALSGPGVYEVALDGLRADGVREPVSAYRFRVDVR
jgi:hypothetical protein